MGGIIRCATNPLWGNGYKENGFCWLHSWEFGFNVRNWQSEFAGQYSSTSEIRSIWKKVGEQISLAFVIGKMHTTFENWYL